MIDFPIVDAHLHAWDPARLPYAWLETVPAINRRFVTADLDAEAGGLRFGGFVFVQAEVERSQHLEETAWVSSLAERDPRIRGIVSFAPLEDGDRVEGELAALAANPLVKGVRRIYEFEPDPFFCDRPGFVRGVQLLSRFGLSFDINIGHAQMPGAIRLVRQCPEVAFVLDHAGKPGIRHGAFEPWASHVRELAALPNVLCKLSGLATEADHARWTVDELRPYADAVLESFGFARTMFGGDWPVVRQAAAYPRWVAAVEECVRGCTRGELRALFRDTAVSFYRLDDRSRPSTVTP
jgi:L-fuconolactonase